MEKINVVKLLRDCPNGMELNCMMYEDVYFDYVDELNIIHCYIQYETYKTPLTLNQHGTPHSDIKSKCVIFPKGKTTWEGFHRPFKDGDILTNDRGSIFIYKGPMFYNKNLADFYCGYRITDSAFIFKQFKDRHFGDINECRFATEEEKLKLFQTIKDNGYKWNSEVKTLEKLIELKFKVGDIVRSKNCPIAGNFVIVGVEGDGYSINLKNHYIKFTEQDNWELVSNKFDITTLKPFDKVLVRCSTLEKWRIQLFEKYDETYQSPFICLGSTKYNQCVPYKGNEYLLNTTDDCDNFYKTWK